MKCSIFWWKEDTINKSSRLGMQPVQPHVTSPLGRYRITLEKSLGFRLNQGSTDRLECQFQQMLLQSRDPFCAKEDRLAGMGRRMTSEVDSRKRRPYL